MKIFLVLFILLVSCTPVDNGWATPYRPSQLSHAPYGVAGYQSMERERIDHLVPETIEWWNSQVGLEVFWHNKINPIVTIDVNRLGTVGKAQVTTDQLEGALLSCSIILDVDLAYSVRTMRLALRHELGHCLGLADDPGIDATVELRSVMGSPLDPLGVLTARDRRLILDLYWATRNKSR